MCECDMRRRGNVIESLREAFRDSSQCCCENRHLDLERGDVLWFLKNLSLFDHITQKHLLSTAMRLALDGRCDSGMRREWVEEIVAFVDVRCFLVDDYLASEIYLSNERRFSAYGLAESRSVLDWLLYVRECQYERELLEMLSTAISYWSERVSQMTIEEQAT